MDERRLQIFSTVAEQRSFTRAAELLHMAQPTISQQVHALEELLGARLFDRTSKSVALTAAGRALYAQVAPLLRAMAEAKRSVLEAAGAVGGRLTVGASLTIGQYLLPRVIADFTRAFPAVEVRLQIQNTEQVAHQVLLGGLDLGLVEGPVAGGEWVQETFLEDEILLIAPPDHLWRQKVTVTLEELRREPLILREPGSGTRRVWEDHLLQVGLRPDDLYVVTEMSSTEAIKGAVEAGMGVAPISQWTIRKELLLGTLLQRRLHNLSVTRSFRTIYPRSHTLLPSAAALIQHLRMSGLETPGRMTSPVVE